MADVSSCGCAAADQAMKNWVPYAAWAVMWVAASAVIGFAIYWTHSASPLWALLIPGSISLSKSKGDADPELE